MSGEADSFRIRAAGPGDIEALEAIERECFPVPWTFEQLEAWALSKNCIFLLAEANNGGILGYAGCQTVLDEGYIANVAVSPAYRRRGIAAALVLALIEAAEKQGLSFLTLEVRESNAPAVSLYESLGFILVGKRRGYYEKPREDALLMTKFLTEV
jgi:ribosomal-protein-alanine N-acetyltransferase